jgi:5-methylcytosine-specific restriction endonuclease McrA
LKRSPLRSKSTKKKVDDTEFDKARAYVIARDGGCLGHRYGIPHACFGGLHVHHVRRRSQGGTNDPSNLVTLCGAAHQWTHEHPTQAHAMGLLSRTGD